MTPKQRDRDHGRALSPTPASSMGYRNAGTLEFLYQDNEFYLHRDEHPRAGGTPGDRARDRHRHRAEADQAVDRRRRAAAVHATPISRSAATPSSAASTPRIRTTFTPIAGTRCAMWHAPGGPGDPRRFSHVYTGYNVPPYYDSMIGKVIVPTATRVIPAIRPHAQRTGGDGGGRHQDQHPAAPAKSSITRTLQVHRRWHQTSTISSGAWD